MNLPNFLTVLRTIMSVATAVLLCFDGFFMPTAAFALFFFAGITDWLDGHIARSQNIVTVFGKFMDALSDKIMVVGLLIVLLSLGMYEGWTIFAMFCALFTVMREFFVSGVRMIAAKEGVVLAAETMGKYKAALQMLSIGGVIFARALKIDFGLDADVCGFFFYASMAALTIATALSSWSGVNYALRYGYLFKD